MFSLEIFGKFLFFRKTYPWKQKKPSNKFQTIMSSKARRNFRRALAFDGLSFLAKFCVFFLFVSIFECTNLKCDCTFPGTVFIYWYLRLSFIAILHKTNCRILQTIKTFWSVLKNFRCFHEVMFEIFYSRNDLKPKVTSILKRTHDKNRKDNLLAKSWSVSDKGRTSISTNAS